MVNSTIYTTIFKVIASLYAISLMVMPSAARADSNACPSPSYYIQNIDASAVAETSEEAREEATSSSVMEAWQRLQNRLLISGQDIPQVTSVDEVLPFLDYTRLVNETVLPSRYQAVFDYCFDRLRLRDYFAENELRHAELMSSAILVLPIWMTPDGPHLWRRPNPWAEAWVRVLSQHDGLLDLRLPSSLATERAIDAAPLMARAPKTLAKAAALEKTERILLMVMTPKQTDTGLIVDVDANLFDKNGRFDAQAYRLEEAAVDPAALPAEVDRIAATLLNGIEDVWRNTNVVNLQDSGVLVVSINARSLKDWRSSIDILSSLTPVEKVSVINLSAKGGLVRLKLGGSITSLNYALEGHGLTLEEQFQDNQGRRGESYLSLVRIVN